MSQIELRYLDIKWLAPGMAMTVSVAPQPIPFEIEEDGTVQAETEIFHDVFPSLGIQLSGALVDSEPVFVAADGKRCPMRPVQDSEGRNWWVEDGPWDSVGRRHLCELHRTIGQFEIEIGEQRLLLNSIAVGLGRVELEDFLQDFQNDLYWLLLSFGAGGAPLRGRDDGGKSNGGATSDFTTNTSDQPIVDALEAFSATVERILERPASAAREVTTLQPLSKLRPNAATFRQYARNPAATKLPGRQAKLTVDIAENRYLRYMIKAAFRLAEKMTRATETQAEVFSAQAKHETARRNEYRSTQVGIVNPTVFDRQLAEMKEDLERVRSCSDGQLPQSNRLPRRFSLSIGRRYNQKGSVQKYFCQKIDGSKSDDEQQEIRFRVIELPPSVELAVIAARPMQPVYEIEAVASVETIGQKGQGRLLKLMHVVSIEPITDAIEKKLRKRKRLEAANWEAPLSREDRDELHQEAHTASLRAQVYTDRATDSSLSAKAFKICRQRLEEQDKRLCEMGVAPEPRFPFGMRFSQSPHYAACLSAFRIVRALADRAGFGTDALDALDKIGILHASALYEHWCLIKILLALTESFRFVPQADWKETLIRGLTGKRETVSINLRHEGLELEARLDVQPVLQNARRPDFRLRFHSNSWHASNQSRRISVDEDSRWDEEPALVMDAKFRNQWRPGDLEDVLATLVETKRYGGEHDRVFILHPAADSKTNPSTPLAWGADCDYGHDAKLSHRKGFIRLAPGKGVSRSSDHLNRLIALHLQSCFPQPGNDPTEPPRSDFSLCIRCGTKHVPEKTLWRKTKRGNPYWIMTCPSCEMSTKRTHCFDCGTPLFKNGFQLTYHKTLADQIMNIYCPACGAYFEQETYNGQELSDE